MRKFFRLAGVDDCIHGVPLVQLIILGNAFVAKFATPESASSIRDGGPQL